MSTGELTAEQAQARLKSGSREPSDYKPRDLWSRDAIS